jgi:hypothetical protein
MTNFTLGPQRAPLVSSVAYLAGDGQLFPNLRREGLPTTRDLAVSLNSAVRNAA